jgi:mono/diheme cytochrome c family protein
MYRRILLPLILAGMAICLANAAMAADLSREPFELGSNPPVLQNIGFVDTTTSLATEADCRVCHDSGVPNRHHLLYGTPIPPGVTPPFPGGSNYSCLSCHGTNFTVVRNCKTCHVANPHHAGQDAINRQCTECHGDLVADFDDGHYIPTYSASLVTPKTSHYGAGWHDEEHTDPWLISDGSGTLAPIDVLQTDTGAEIQFGVEVVRNDPNELRFTPVGYNNDFMIDEPNRSSNVYKVTFNEGASLAAFFSRVGTTSSLTVTLAPSQTAQQVVDTINQAVALVAASGARVRASLLHDGEDPVADALDETEYAPRGGDPFNNRGFGAGSCSYCHDDDGQLDINGDPDPALIINNHDTHHGISLPGTVVNGTPGVPTTGTWSRCNVCHEHTTLPRNGSYDQVGGPAFELHIRVCQECHSVATLHNIQGDSDDNGIVVGGELAGYGHVGRDNGPEDSDCWGCHGFDFNAASAPFTGPLVPTLYSTDIASVPAGKDTVVVLNGAAFSNTAGGKSYEADVRLTAANGTTVTLEPELVLDEGSMAVKIPAKTRPGNYRIQAVKGEMASNPSVLTVTPTTRITRATYRGAVTILGSGFGGHAEGASTSVTGTVTSGSGRRTTTKQVPGSIVSWTDTKIVVNFGTLPRQVTVNSVFGNAKATVSR